MKDYWRLKMNKTSKILIGVLVLQLALVAAFLLRRENTAFFKPSTKLLNITSDSFNTLIIQQTGQTPLTLKKKDGAWVIPSLSDFPVLPERVQTSIQKLVDMPAGWPVGKTKIASKQFKTSADSCEKKATFAKDDKPVKNLYIGTSPSFRKVHARVDESDLTFEIDFSSFELSVRPKDWADKDYYRLAPEKVKSLTIGPLTLAKKEMGWALSDLAETEESKTEDAYNFVMKALTIPFDDILGTEEKPGYITTTPDSLTFQAETNEGEIITYTLSAPYGADSRVLKISKYPYFFKVRNSAVDFLMNAARDQFVKPKESQAEPAVEPKAESKPAHPVHPKPKK